MSSTSSFTNASWTRCSWSSNVSLCQAMLQSRSRKWLRLTRGRSRCYKKCSYMASVATRMESATQT
eukprot:2616597-Amphidinium_carterae.1